MFTQNMRENTQFRLLEDRGTFFITIVSQSGEQELVQFKMIDQRMEYDISDMIARAREIKDIMNIVKYISEILQDNRVERPIVTNYAARLFDIASGRAPTMYGNSNLPLPGSSFLPDSSSRSTGFSNRGIGRDMNTTSQPPVIQHPQVMLLRNVPDIPMIKRTTIPGLMCNPKDIVKTFIDTDMDGIVAFSYTTGMSSSMNSADDVVEFTELLDLIIDFLKNPKEVPLPVIPQNVNTILTSVVNGIVSLSGVDIDEITSFKIEYQIYFMDPGNKKSMKRLRDFLEDKKASNVIEVTSDVEIRYPSSRKVTVISDKNNEALMREINSLPEELFGKFNFQPESYIGKIWSTATSIANSDAIVLSIILSSNAVSKDIYLTKDGVGYNYYDAM